VAYTTAIIGSDAYGDQERLVVRMVIFLRVGASGSCPAVAAATAPC
jgi:hypothetical protein